MPCVCAGNAKREPTSTLLWFGHCVIIHWFTAISYPNNQKSTYTQLCITFLFLPNYIQTVYVYFDIPFFIWHDDDNYTPLSVQLQLVLMLLLLLSFPFFFFLSYILLPLPFIPLQQLPQNEKILIPIFFLKKPKKKKLTHYNLLLTTYMFI